MERRRVSDELGHPQSKDHTRRGAHTLENGTNEKWSSSQVSGPHAATDSLPVGTQLQHNKQSSPNELLSLQLHSEVLMLVTITRVVKPGNAGYFSSPTNTTPQTIQVHPPLSNHPQTEGQGIVHDHYDLEHNEGFHVTLSK